jgi:hypothetical protein
MSVAHPPHPELVLLCGGTEQQRAKLRRSPSVTTESRTAVTTRDVHSLLRWAPRSRAVIVCGELAGIGVATIERIVQQHAPGVPVITGVEGFVNGDSAGQRPQSAPATSNGVSRSKRRLALA